VVVLSIATLAADARSVVYLFPSRHLTSCWAAYPAENFSRRTSEERLPARLPDVRVALHEDRYRPIDRLTVRVPLAKPVRVVRSVEHGPLRFTEDRASPALRGQGYHSVAVFATRLGLNDIILLE
jgi:hypothetical protein